MLKPTLLAQKKCQGQKNRFVDSKAAKALLVIVLFLAVFLFALPALAVNLNVGLEYAKATGLGTQDIRVTIANIINAALGFLGILAVLIILYGGWIWMTSGGEPEKINTAKKILINGAIGLLIILMAYAIASFILNLLLEATGIKRGGPIPGYGDGGGALGAGIIESHYPPRNAFNIPRNTSIVVTFKQKIDPASIIGANDLIDPNSVKIYKKADPNNLVTNVKAYVTPDQRTFVFKPQTLLGGSDQPYFYTVKLTNNVRKYDGSNAFGSYDGYNWTFEVSTLIDITPPQVVNVIPVATSTVVKNTIIRVDFNEAINPMTIGGIVAVDGDGKTGNLAAGTFNYLNVYFDEAGTNKYVAGEFFYSNQYRTVEFVTNDNCGQNSCGENIYCLPGLKALTTLVKAADLQPDSKVAKFPYNGVVDMADNSLDGDKDTNSEGQPTDNYSWNFNTNDVIDLEPPLITAIFPEAGQVGVRPDAVFQVNFDKILASYTVKPDSGYNDGKEYFTLVQPTPSQLSAKGYPLGGWGYSLSNQLLPTVNPVFTSVFINPQTLGDNLPFSLRIGSGVKTNTQNCYLPCADTTNCKRIPGSVPGQYLKGTPWTPDQSFPTCDLSGTNYQSVGKFTLSYDDTGVNKIFNFGSFSLIDINPSNTTIDKFYDYASQVTQVDKHGGVFKQMLAVNRVVSLIYFSQKDNKYYWVNFYGQPDPAGLNGSASTTFTGSANSPLSVVIKDDPADVYSSAGNSISIIHSWPPTSSDGEAVLFADGTKDVTVEFDLATLKFGTGVDNEWYFYSPEGPIKLAVPGKITISFSK